MTARAALALGLAVALASGCGSRTGPSTAGEDASSPDARLDAEPDAMLGAEPDAAPRAVPDAAPDAAPDTGPVDAGRPPPHPWVDHPLLVPGPLVIAHRGGRRIAPENTLVAFDLAWQGGADVLEVDLHGTADGVVVALHDDTVDRTTDGTGRIARMTFAAVRELDAGYTFGGGQGFPYRGMGVTIPSLEEVLTAFPDAPLSLEIKQAEPPIVDAVVAALDAHDARGRVVVSSFADATIRAFREAAPDVLTGLALGEIIAWITLPPGPDARPWQPPGHFLQIPIEQAGFVLIDPVTVAHARRHGLPVHPWTINDVDVMEELLDLEVAGIITDDPLVLRALIDARR